MAIPTISTVAPSTGPAGGTGLVDITGANFRVVPAPASGQTSGIDTPRVRVTFGGVIAERVQVHLATHLTAVPPPYSGNADLATFVAVDVVVQNLDDSGQPIVGENATLASGYIYRREPLRPPTLDLESPFARITRKLLQLLKAQVLQDTSPGTHTDYSADGLFIKYEGQPSLVLEGPEVAQASYQERSELYWEAQLDGSAVRHGQAVLHALSYALLGASDSHTEMLALLAAVRQFMHRNVYLTLPGDVPAGGVLRMPLASDGGLDVSRGPRESNLHLFRAPFVVRQVPVLYLPPDMRAWPLSTIQLQTQTLTGTLVYSTVL